MVVNWTRALLRHGVLELLNRHGRELPAIDADVDAAGLGIIGQRAVTVAEEVPRTVMTLRPDAHRIGGRASS